MNATLTNSEGCNENPPMCIQFFAPYSSLPSTSTAARMRTERIASGRRIFFVLSRSRSHQPSTKNEMTPAKTIIICLSISSGTEEAMTESPMEDRKNAMVSTSKPLRLMLRMAK